MPVAAQRSTAPSMPRRTAAPRASSASRRARRVRSRSGQLEPPERLTVPTSVSPSPSQPSALGRVPLSRASGSRVNTGLRASMGPTIEMSPRALARASRAFMLMARADDAMMAGQTQSGDDALEVICTAGGDNDGSTRWQGGGGHGGRNGNRPRGLAGLGRGGSARGGQRLRRERRRQPALERAREPGGGGDRVEGREGP